jgi:hypothetical protein
MCSNPIIYESLFGIQKAAPYIQVTAKVYILSYALKVIINFPKYYIKGIRTDRKEIHF